MKKILSLLLVFLMLPVIFFINSPQVKADTLQAIGPVQFRLNLSKSIPFISANKAHQSNFKGQGTHIVVIDSGVDKTNPFIGNKVVLEACFAPTCPNGTTEMIGSGAAKPVHWHGTHVAGIVAGSNASMTGVAPEAKIIAVNIFDSLGSTYDSNIVRALSWVDSISSQYNIAAVNMSLGTNMVFRSSCNSYIPDLTSIISKLKSKNIATVVSAGNSYSYGMSSPACITDTVSVAATLADKNVVTDFSNIHEDTDFSAPGYMILSSSLGDTFRTASGTSMAAPHVAGAYAVYRSKFGIKSVDDVTRDFQNSSVPAIDNYTRINSKRIDFSYLFGTDQPPVTTTTTTTTVPSPTTTTTIPRPTTTTTVAPKPPDEDVEFGLTVPEILNIRKYVHNTSYLYLDFRYTSTLTNVSSYMFECTYQGSDNVSRSLPNRGNSLNFYFVRISTLDIISCRMAVVSKSGKLGQYTEYFNIK
jgi:subtilisin family serine protease